MKKYLIILFTLLLFILTQGLTSGDELADLFNSANKLYAEKNYLKALDLYLEIIERGIVNPDLYYNIANTYFKLGKKGLAILYYEKALKILPFDREIRENLKYVEKTIESASTGSKKNLAKFFTSIQDYINLRILSYIELGFFVFFIGLFLAYTFIRHMRFSIRPYLITTLIVFICLLSGVVFIHRYSLKHPKGIIVESKVEVLEAPISTSEPSFLLTEGTKIKIVEERGKWILVITDDGKQGWITANQFEKI